MNMRSIGPMALLGVAARCGRALAAETGNPSLVDAAKQGDRASGALPARQPREGRCRRGGRHDRVDLGGLPQRRARWPIFCCVQAPTSKAANEYGATALYAAAANADPAMTAKLLAAGADANAHLLSGETPLMEAARRGNLATLRLLLSGGADPNAQEANGGQTALMWAISERHAAVTEELVRQRRRHSRPFEKRIHRVDVRRPARRCGFRRASCSAPARMRTTSCRKRV